MMEKPNNPREFRMKEMDMMGFMLSQNSGGLHLMQNCDLPPPVKLFSGPDKVVLSLANGIRAPEGNENLIQIQTQLQGAEIGNMELLKALGLSQTRAREAEKKYAALCKEKDAISKLMVQESFTLFAHRQWLKMLELRMSQLERRGRHRQQPTSCINDDDDGASCNWYRAIAALCLAIAGIGFAFGWRYVF